MHCYCRSLPRRDSLGREYALSVAIARRRSSWMPLLPSTALLLPSPPSAYPIHTSAELATGNLLSFSNSQSEKGQGPDRSRRISPQRSQLAFQRRHTNSTKSSSPPIAIVDRNKLPVEIATAPTIALLQARLAELISICISKLYILTICLCGLAVIICMRSLIM